MVDPVIEEKLESLRRCLKRVEQRTPGTLEQLASDLDAQDIVSLNLLRAVQIMVDIALRLLSEREAAAPPTMADAIRQLVPAGILTQATADRMARAVGFRNIAVHAYRDVDWAIVFAIATQHTEDFRQFMREVVKFGGMGKG